MRVLIIVFVLLPSVCFSTASPTTISQKRLPNETFHQAFMRAKKSMPKTVFPESHTAMENRVPIMSIDYSKVPSVKTHQELINVFHLVRDSRFLATKNNPDFLRRITWLYPDEGCFARAALGGIKADDADVTRPAKIFAFGRLQVKTPFSPEGSVSWWFHVALVIGYMGDYYVIDPAIDQHAPMPVYEWYETMSYDTRKLTGVVCNQYTYSALDDCFNATSKSDARAESDESSFLDDEWQRVKALGFDPNLILGESPPWA